MRLPNIFEREHKPVHYAAGDVIFHEGDAPDSMYFVAEGSVELTAAGRMLAAVEKDGIFGEMALIDAEPRSATATALTDCALHAIDQKQFTFMVQETPFFAIEVMRV